MKFCKEIAYLQEKQQHGSVKLMAQLTILCAELATLHYYAKSPQDYRHGSSASSSSTSQHTASALQVL